MKKLLVIAALIYLVALSCAELPARATTLDFGSYYTWAVMAAAGTDPYSTARVDAAARQLGVAAMRANYPPSFIFLTMPLARVPPARAFWIWSAVNLAALIAAAWLLAQGDGAMFALVVFFGPASDSLFWGQPEAVILLCLVLARRALDSGRDWLAGLSVGFASLLKLYPIFLLGYFLFRRRRDALFWSIGAILLGAALTVVELGNLAPSFIREVFMTGGDRFVHEAANVALGAVLQRMLPVEFALALTALIQVALLLVLILKTLRSRDDSWGLWLLASIALCPVIWFHSLTLAIPAIVAATGRRDHFGWLSYGFASLGFCALWLRWLLWPRLDSATVATIAASGALCLLAGFAAELRFRRPGCNLL